MDSQTGRNRLASRSVLVSCPDEIRANWIIGHNVKIYSRSENTWYDGEITEIMVHKLVGGQRGNSNKDRLVVKYKNGKKKKEIQRDCPDIKPIPNHQSISITAEPKTGSDLHTLGSPDSAPNNTQQLDSAYYRTNSIGDETELNEEQSGSEAKSLQQSLERVFDQYIDPENKGEVDPEEWVMGLRKLNVQLNEMQQKVLFKLVDIDNGGTVDKDEFITTMMGQSDSEAFNLLRQPILEAVLQLQNQQKHADSKVMGTSMSAMVEPLQVSCF